MTHEQRKKFFAMCGDIARQVPLMVGGQPVMADKDSWKLVFTCALVGEQRIAEGLNGQQVVLGMRLRDIFRELNDDEARWTASELIELVAAFGAERGVKFADQEGA